MRTLELKDIAAYLPYDVEYIYKDSYCCCMRDKEVIIGLSILNSGISITMDTPLGGEEVTISAIKPVLHPMSDLSKEITVKGYNEDKPFIPLIKIAEACYPEAKGGWHIDENGWAKVRINGSPTFITPGDVNIASYDIFDMLSQWHFDYRGLIEEGLAIDINN